MKATIEYNLTDESDLQRYHAANLAPNFASVIHEMKAWLQEKVNESGRDEFVMAQRRFNTIMDEKGVK